MKGEKITAKSMWQVLKDSFSGFDDDRVLKLSGALAYYTVFSMGPLLIVIIFLAGMFLGQEAVQGKIYEQLSGFMGQSTAAQLQEIIKNAAVSDKGTMAATVGVITLLIGATSVFAEVQDSINGIWGLKPKPKRGWLKMLQNRFLSFSVIISLGFILLVSLGITAIIDGFSKGLQARFPDVAVVIFYIFNQLLTLAIISMIFAVIYKVLPDAKIKIRDVIPGAILAAVLFMLGKFGVSLYISKTNVGSTYGTAGSLVIILLWCYFSAIVLYYGAEFTKAYALKFGEAIHPNHYAVTTKQVEVELGSQPVKKDDPDEIPVTGKDSAAFD
ncbi:MAG: YihY/virulence factor BrkB family protein [Chitinophagaceae bacterium]|nr:MAG: YihY/virulence factor BrkB family protein [Chitinophagaceae bacterium]